MKKVISFLALVLVVSLGSLSAQDVQTIDLEQTPGAFTQDELTLAEGDYVFNVHNKDAGTDVGLVLVPEGKDASNPDNHIKEAYVTQVVGEGKTESTKTVHLEKGKYVYFCPLNKTSQYTLTVE